MDDPDGTAGRTYVTILGAVIASGKLARWGTPALSAYLAAMAAERHDSAARTGSRKAGDGRWFRSAAWFADAERKYGPDARVRLPFSVPTLERGLHPLRSEGLVSWERHAWNLRTTRRLAGPRNVYTNRFGQLEVANNVIPPAKYGDQLASDQDDE